MGLRPLPALLQADGDCLAAAPDDPFRGHAGPLALERGPATSPLFRRSSRRPRRPATRTDDVNGYRQEGFAPFDRNIRNGRRLSASRRVPAPGAAPPEPRGPDAGIRHPDPVRGPPGGRRGAGPRGGGTEPIRAGEVILAGGAINSPQLLQLSRRRRGRRAGGRSGSTSSRTCPGSASTSRTTSRSTSSTPHPAGLDAAVADQKWRRPWIGFQWLFLRRGPGATNHFEGGGFVREQRRRRLPEPDVPLPAARDPLRRLGPAGGHGYQVHVGPMYSDARGSVKIVSTDPNAPGAALQLPLDRPGPARVGRGDPGRPADPRPAGVRPSSTAARRRPAPESRPTRRSSTGSPATPRPRSTRRAPPGWARTRCRSSTR